MSYKPYLSAAFLMMLLFHKTLLYSQQQLKITSYNNSKREIAFRKGDAIMLKCIPFEDKLGSGAVWRTRKDSSIIVGGRIVSINDSVLFIKGRVAPGRWSHPVGIPVSHILQIRKPHPGIVLGTNALFAAGAIALQLSFAQIPVVLLGTTGLVYAMDRAVLSRWRNTHQTTWKGKNRWHTHVTDQ